jgi:hypothetical protein
MTAPRYLLVVLGTAFIVQGLLLTVFPELLDRLLQISAASTTGRIEIQVMYGGLPVGLGIACLLGARAVIYTSAVLQLMLLLLLGLAVPRVTLALYHGDYSVYSMVAMILESGTAALIGWLLLGLRDQNT